MQASPGCIRLLIMPNLNGVRSVIMNLLYPSRRLSNTRAPQVDQLSQSGYHTFSIAKCRFALLAAYNFTGRV